MKSNVLIKYALMLLCLMAMQAYAQNTDNEQVKRLKRAIFIFNVAEQTLYGDTHTDPNFVIGGFG
ncbi:hypothetical protein [Algibacter lectus]|nr:hypothetical protein [Algibacter lectus]